MDSAPKYPRSLHKDSVTFCKALMQKNPKKRLGCEGLPAKGNSDVKVSHFKGSRPAFISLFSVIHFSQTSFQLIGTN